MNETYQAVIGIGGNIEPRLVYLRQAVAGLGAMEGTRLIAVSPVYETEPWGVTDQARFLNAAALIETAREPLALLEALQALETRVGRDRSAEARRWGPRVIDLDILLIPGRFIDGERLAVPHPRLCERAFALRPLLDVLPGAVDPRDGAPLRARLDALAGASLRLLASPNELLSPA